MWQAEHHPDVGFIGCEPFINGVASLLGKIEASGLDTIRIHDGDARDVLAWLPPNSIIAHLHAVPRPLAEEAAPEAEAGFARTVAQLARVLRPGGELRFATDNGDYAGEALLTILASGAFAWTAERPRIGGCGLSTGRKPATSGRP